MNRILVALVVVQAVVIALLAYHILGDDDHARTAADRVSAEADLRPGKSATPDEARSDPAAEPESASAPKPGSANTPGTALLHGEITSSDGAALKPPVWISATRPGEDPEYGQLQRERFYSIAGLPPGRYEFRVAGQAYDDYKTEIDLSPGVHRRDVELAAAMEIRIRVVTPEGKSLQKAVKPELAMHLWSLSAVATKQPVEELPLSELRTNSRYGVGTYQSAWEFQRPGTAKLPDEVAGVLQAKAKAPFHVSLLFMHLVLDAKRVDAPVGELTFTVRPEDIDACLATVKVRIVDRDSGDPVPCRVTVSNRQGGGGGVAADEEGRVVYPSVPPGLKHFQVWAKDHEMVNMFLPVLAGGEHDLGTIRLAKATTITGRVSGPDGKPLSVSLEVRNLDRMTVPQPISVGMQRQSDAEGKFNITQQGRGRILLRASHKELGLAAAIVDTTAGDVENVEVKFEPCVDVTLTPEHDGAWSDLVTIRRDGVPWFTRRIYAWYPLRAKLPRGRYAIECASSTKVTKTIPLEVGEKPVELTITP